MDEQNKSNQYLETVIRLWDRIPWYARVKIILLIEWYALPRRMRVFVARSLQWIG